MIRELAEYEHELDRVTIRERDLQRDGFGDTPRFRALIAEWDKQAAGYAVFFAYYSTRIGRGLYLEDLFVREQFRGRAIGTALLARVARIAQEDRCCALHSEVLNLEYKSNRDLYGNGGRVHEQWRRVLLTGEALERLAKKA